MRREFLQLAARLNPARHDVSGFFISEKLDGTRCFWDGGVSRDIPTTEVPWASVINPRTGEKKTKIKPYATGLWSRYGNPIIAPDWFLNSLPACFLDGELWAGRGNFQLCRSICAGDEPDPRFDKIKYAVYSAPRTQDLFQNGEIKNPNTHCNIDADECRDYLKDRLIDYEGDFLFSDARNFREEVSFMGRVFEAQHKFCFPLHQEELPINSAHIRVARRLEAVLQLGGEGVVLRDPNSRWLPKRHNGILKWKPYLDAESIVTGFTSGRETTKGSRLRGSIGALITNFNEKRLELSGLTDEERLFATADQSLHAYEHPGEDMPNDFQGVCFKTGQRVTFKYRELTDDGIPKEACFFRKRGVE